MFMSLFRLNTFIIYAKQFWVSSCTKDVREEHTKCKEDEWYN